MRLIGQVVGYQRHLAPSDLMGLDLNTRLDEMLGSWRGRILEEQISDVYNEALVLELKKVWDTAKTDEDQKAFVRLDDPDLENEILKDAWKVIPQDTKDYIKKTFGTDGFMVRRDMCSYDMYYSP